MKFTYKRWMFSIFLLLVIPLACVGSFLFIQKPSDDEITSNGTNFKFSIGICYVYGKSTSIMRYTGYGATIDFHGVVGSNFVTYYYTASQDALEYSNQKIVAPGGGATVNWSSSAPYASYFDPRLPISDSSYLSAVNKPTTRIWNHGYESDFDTPNTSRPYYNFYWYTNSGGRGNLGANSSQEYTVGAFNTSASYSNEIYDATYMYHEYSSGGNYSRYGRTELVIPQGWGYYGIIDNNLNAVQNFTYLYQAGSGSGNNSAVINEYFGSASGGGNWSQNQSNISASTNLQGNFMAVMRKQYTATYKNTNGTTTLSTAPIYAGLYFNLPDAGTGYRWQCVETGAYYESGATFSAEATGRNLTFQKSPKQYTVSFDSQGGSTVSSKTVTYGQTYGTLPTPTRTGYTHSGWYNSNGNRITSSSTVSIASNHTLYAQWKAAERVTVNTGGNYGYKNLVDAAKLCRRNTGDDIYASWDDGAGNVRDYIVINQRNQQHYSYFAKAGSFTLQQTANTGTGGDHSTAMHFTVTIPTAGQYYIWLRMGKSMNSSTHVVSDFITTTTSNAYVQVFYAKQFLNGGNDWANFVGGQSTIFQKSGRNTVTFSEAGTYRFRFDNEFQEYIHISDFMVTPTTPTNSFGQGLPVQNYAYHLCAPAERTGYTFRGWIGEMLDSNNNSLSTNTYRIGSSNTSHTGNTSYLMNFSGAATTAGIIWGGIMKYTNSIISANVTPIWEAKTTSIYTNGGGISSSTPRPPNFVYGNGVPSFAMPSAPGYTFNGYWTASSGGVQLIDPDGNYIYNSTTSSYFADDHTWKNTSFSLNLYAHWISNKSINVYIMTSNDGTNYTNSYSGGDWGTADYCNVYNSCYGISSYFSSNGNAFVTIDNIKLNTNITLNYIFNSSGYICQGAEISSQANNHYKPTQAIKPLDIINNNVSFTVTNSSQAIYVFFTKTSGNILQFNTTENNVTYKPSAQYGFARDYSAPVSPMNGWWKSTNAGQSNTSSVLEVEFLVDSQTEITFDYFVSTESSYDYLIVYLNNNIMLAIATSDNGHLEKYYDGEVIYGSGKRLGDNEYVSGTKSLALPSGTSGKQTIKFQYNKDGSGDNNYDAVWINVHEESFKKGYFYFENGLFPQTLVTGSAADVLDTYINPLSDMVSGISYFDGKSDVTVPIYRYGNECYAKLVATKNMTLNFGGAICNFSKNSGYWFKCDPICWRVSPYEVSESDYPSGWDINKAYQENFAVVSDKILFAGVANSRLVEEQSYLDTDVYSRLNTIMSNLCQNLNFEFSYKSNSSLSCPKFSANGAVKPNSGNTATASSKYLRVSSLDEIRANNGDYLKARLTQFAAFILGVDEGYYNYGTRDLGTNLNNIVSVSKSGQTSNCWVNTMQGFRLTFVFSEGSRS